MPDFIIRLNTDVPVHVILETKGCDPLPISSLID